MIDPFLTSLYRRFFETELEIQSIQKNNTFSSEDEEGPIKQRQLLKDLFELLQILEKIIDDYIKAQRSI